MSLSGRAWIGALPRALDRQKVLLERLLILAEDDAAILWLLIGCSLERDQADRLSDLDLGMGIKDDDFADSTQRILESITSMEGSVDSFLHRMPELTTEHARVFAQFADRTQVDLVMFPASQRSGFVPNTVILYDPGNLLSTDGERRSTSARLAREWSFLAWCALIDIGKYLRRRSPWEALARLDQARGYVWKLIALAEGIREPQYGLTSLWDFARDRVPPEMEGTVSDLDLADLLGAAKLLAEILHQVESRLSSVDRRTLPHAMEQFVVADLARVEIPGRSPGPSFTDLTAELILPGTESG